MSLFRRKEKDTIRFLEKKLNDATERINFLENLCEEKDSYFMEMISDGLRHGSSRAGQHMSDRKKYLNGK